MTSSAVDLLTNLPLTPGASYRLDVDGIVDGSAVFTGFVPPRPANRVFDLYRFLPELNRREDVTGDETNAALAPTSAPTVRKLLWEISGAANAYKYRLYAELHALEITVNARWDGFSGCRAISHALPRNLVGHPFTRG